MIYQDLPKPFFVLAPMDDVTDTVFRQMIASTTAPDLFFTEFINVDALQSAGRKATMTRLQHKASEKPIIAQIWGKTPENYYKSAKDIAAMGFNGVDINMGCPAKDVVSNGCGSALINNRELTLEIIQATREGLASYHPYSDGSEQRAAGSGNSSISLLVPKGTTSKLSEPPATTTPSHSSSRQTKGGRGLGTSLPLSVKTRLGFHEIDYSWHELLLKQKLNALSIHGRTKQQMSKVPADWAAIGHIRKMRDLISPATKIIGNGDVETRQHGLELAKTHKLDGIMIGRGVFIDPFVFAKDSPWQAFFPKQKKDLYTKHVKLFAKTWKNNEKPVPVLNKFCKIYISGFDGAKELRVELMQAKTTKEILNILRANPSLSTDRDGLALR